MRTADQKWTYCRGSVRNRLARPSAAWTRGGLPAGRVHELGMLDGMARCMTRRLPLTGAAQQPCTSESANKERQVATMPTLTTRLTAHSCVFVAAPLLQLLPLLLPHGCVSRRPLGKLDHLHRALHRVYILVCVVYGSDAHRGNCQMIISSVSLRGHTPRRKGAPEVVFARLPAAAWHAACFPGGCLQLRDLSGSSRIGRLVSLRSTTDLSWAVGNGQP